MVHRVDAEHVLVDGIEAIDAVSTDYLRLDGVDFSHSHGELTPLRHGSSRGSPFLGGTSATTQQTEQSLAESLGLESAMLCSSGWLAGYSVTRWLLEERRPVLTPGKLHNCVQEAIRASGGDPKLVIQFAASGQTPDRAIYSLLDGTTGRWHGELGSTVSKMSLLAVDASHCLFLPGMTDVIDSTCALVFGSLSKALGASLGFAAGRRADIESLRQAPTPWMFSAAVSDGACALLRHRLSHSAMLHSLAQQAAAAGETLRTSLAAAGCEVSGGSHIVSVRAPALESDPLGVEDALLEQGVFALVARYPTRPRGEAVLRLYLSAAHTNGAVRTIASVVSRTLVH